VYVTADLAAHSQLLADDLHALLRGIDPVRWKDEAETAVREEIVTLRARMRTMIEAVEEDPANAAFAVVGQRLDEIGRLMDGAMPARGLAGQGLRRAWNDYRLEIQPAYERLAATLKPLDIHVQSLRPTNYARNIYHAASGLFAVWLVDAVLPATWLLPVAVVLTVMAWTLELSRRRWSQINSLLMWAFRPFAHPHEAWRINSATWFTTALFVLALTGRPMVVAVALVVLALGDPAAALIGRRFGTVKLVNGRSLQGTLTFVVVGALASLALLAWRHPEVGPGPAVAMSLVGATAGAVAELFARRVDDNLAIPTAVAAALLVVMASTGLL
jgi:dolichol kinase